MKKSFAIAIVMGAFLSVFYMTNISLADKSTLGYAACGSTDASSLSAVIFNYTLDDPLAFAEGKIQISTQSGANFTANIVPLTPSPVLQGGTSTTLNLSSDLITGQTYYWRIALLVNSRNITTSGYCQFQP